MSETMAGDAGRGTPVELDALLSTGWRDLSSVQGGNYVAVRPCFRPAMTCGSFALPEGPHTLLVLVWRGRRHERGYPDGYSECFTVDEACMALLNHDYDTLAHWCDETDSVFAAWWNADAHAGGEV